MRSDPTSPDGALLERRTFVVAITSPISTKRSRLSCWHADAAADAFRAREPRVRVGHGANARLDVGREGRGLAHGHVDMDRHVLRSGREPAIGRVTQLLKGVKPLL